MAASLAGIAVPLRACARAGCLKPNRPHRSSKYCSDTCGSHVREHRARMRNPEYGAERRTRDAAKLEELKVNLGA